MDTATCRSYAEKAYTLAIEEKNDKEAGRALMLIATNYEQQLEWDQYIQINEKALHHYTVAKELELQLDALNNIGYVYNYIGEYDKAIQIFKNAVNIIEENKIEGRQLGVMLINQSFAYLYTGKLDSTKTYITKALSAAEVAKDTTVLIEGNNNLGIIYKREGNYKKALEHFEESLHLYELTNDKRKLCTVWMNIANVYDDWGNLDKALELTRKALAIAQENDIEQTITGQILSSIGLYLTKKDQYSAGLDTLRIALPYFKNNKYQFYLLSLYFSHAFEKMNQLDSCDLYLQKAENILEQNKNYPAVRLYSTKGTLLFKRGKYNEAIPVLENYVKELSKTSNRTQLSESYILYNTLSEAYKLGPKDYKSALYYKELAFGKRDSLYKDEHNNTINDFYARYETAEKELEISRLNEEKQKTKYESMLTIAIILLFFVLLFIAFLYNRIKRIKKEKEAILLAEKVKQKDTEYKILLTETKQNMLRKYLEGKESERKSLAKELHDSVANDIISIIMLYETGKKKEQVRLMLKETYTHIRQISHQLMPPEFKCISLIDMLEDHVDVLNNSMSTHYYITLTDPDIPAITEKFSDNQMKEIYYIVQEVLGNIRKHANAKNGEVKFSLNKEKKLILSIIDDGKGFNVQQTKRGIGLQTIKDRCLELNAELAIESVIEKGTKITISLFYSTDPVPDHQCLYN